MSPRGLPLYALQVFEVAARHLSFTRAASELYLTQGAVSKQIAQLEAQLGYPLFRREVRQLSLTAQGEALLPFVSRAFATLHKGLDKSRLARNRLRLKAPSCASRWLLRQLEAFRQAYPEMEVELTSSHDHSVAFGKEPFDLAICYGPLKKETPYPLFAERLTPVCSPGLLQRQGKALRSTADLAQFTLLHPTRDRQDWQQWLKASGARDINPDSGQLFDTLDQAMNAALQGFGVSLGDPVLLEEELSGGTLQAHLTPVLVTGKGYAIELPAHGQISEAATLLADWLSERAQETYPRE